MKRATVTKKRSPIDYLKATARRFATNATWGGLVLIFSTIVAITASNTGLADEYNEFWEKKFIIAGENFDLNMTLHHWVNDGLMVIFFLVIGLELKREILVGALSDWGKASMPVYAAIGGMIIPALIYWSLNADTPYEKGWGIPMATDIAYSLGLLGLLGTRVPSSLKIFLTALAIVDDLGAILIIAFFYSDAIDWHYLAVGAGITGGLFLINYLGVRQAWIYLLTGFFLWYAIFMSGIHATIAGILLAATIPLKVRLRSREFMEKTEEKLKELKETDLERGDALSEEKHQEIIKDIRRFTIDSRSPLLRTESNLSYLSLFFIVPVFALANAGVTFVEGWTSIFTSTLGLGIIFGLVVGKFTGVFLFSFLAHHLHLSKLNVNLKWSDIAGMALLTGVGFTMSLFISNLAFGIKGGILENAKMAILIASAIAAFIGFFTLLSTSSKK